MIVVVVVVFVVVVVVVVVAVVVVAVAWVAEGKTGPKPALFVGKPAPLLKPAPGKTGPLT